MPRPNTGPRLVHLTAEEYARQGYKRRILFIRGRAGGRAVQFSTGTDDLGEAQARLEAYLAEIATRPDGPCAPDEIDVAEILAIYGEDVAPDTADPARIGNCMEALVNYWGERPVADVKGETCRGYAKHRRNLGISDGTIRRELGTLQAAGRHCNREGYLTIFPLLWMPPAPPPKDRWLTRQEAAKLIRTIRNTQSRVERYLVPFILISLYSSARKRSVLALQWEPNTDGGHVDLERGLIDFNPVGRATTKKRKPRIPIPPRLFWILRRQRRTTTRWVIERANGDRLADVKKGFGEATQAAGLKGVTPHTLVHTSVTWLVQQGLDLELVAQWTSKTVEILQRVYWHHHPDYLAEVRDVWNKDRNPRETRALRR